MVHFSHIKLPLYPELKLTNIGQRNTDTLGNQLAPMIGNPWVLSEALRDNTFTVSSKDLLVIRRDLTKAVDYFTKTGQTITSVMEDDILIDKVIIMHFFILIY